MYHSLAGTGPITLVLKRAKEYGTRQFAKSRTVEGERALVIEDVVNSANQVVPSIEDLRSAGSLIQEVVYTIGRQADGPETLAVTRVLLRVLLAMEAPKAAGP